MELQATIPTPVLDYYIKDNHCPFEFELITKYFLPEEEYIGFLLGNFMKYIARLGKKSSGDQDLFKAMWYLRKLYGAVNDKFTPIPFSADIARKLLNNDRLEDMVNFWKADLQFDQEPFELR